MCLPDRIRCIQTALGPPLFCFHILLCSSLMIKRMINDNTYYKRENWNITLTQVFRPFAKLSNGPLVRGQTKNPMVTLAEPQRSCEDGGSTEASLQWNNQECPDWRKERRFSGLMKARLDCLASIPSVMSGGNQTPLITCPISSWYSWGAAQPELWLEPNRTSLERQEKWL